MCTSAAVVLATKKEGYVNTVKHNDVFVNCLFLAVFKFFFDVFE